MNAHSLTVPRSNSFKYEWLGGADRKGLNMNQVSWLIYLSNVVGNLGAFLACLCVALVSLSVVYGIQFLADSDALNKVGAKAATHNLRIALVWTAIVAFINVMVPDSGTVMGIAASQVGERVLKSDTANLAEQALNAWLERQIASPVAVPAK